MTGSNKIQRRAFVQTHRTVDDRRRGLFAGTVRVDIFVYQIHHLIDPGITTGFVDHRAVVVINAFREGGQEIFRLARNFDLNFLGYDPFTDPASVTDLGVRMTSLGFSFVQSDRMATTSWSAGNGSPPRGFTTIEP